MTATIPEEAITAALAKWMELPSTGDASSLKRDMRAALPFLPVQVAVKKLEWHKGVEFGAIAAHGAGVDYTIWSDFSLSISPMSPREYHLARIVETEDQEAAKAAAQADYEARILSALEPSAARQQKLPVDRIERFDSADPTESIGCFGGSGQWIELGTVEEIRALSSPDHADTGKSEGDGWQPIESAPKDGTKLDVWMLPHGYRETDVFWSDIQDIWCRESEYEDEPTPLSLHPYPAFWRPIPSAPASEGGE
ncbi:MULTISPECIES: hypothetical protein [unclassified Brucella]|uniref:hypothetical protein n=1 Tax=unclassified Brucella TaxID=2632610 RepID=UPI00217F077A|nr:MULTISPECIES: hypothetical protein [unclassified Brucella]UWF67339.1 hypothetical protein NYO63_04145 [Brucella sp. 1315]UWF70464.1 hypothetical protein NYO65_04145 [Brucella sp. 2594]